MPLIKSLKKLQSDQGAILVQFYRKYQPWLLNHLRQRLGNSADAEDICQQIFLRFWEQPDLLDSINNPRAWLATTANRLCVDHWRRAECGRRVIESAEIASEPAAPSVEKQLADRQSLQAIYLELNKLPLQTRSIIIHNRIHRLTGQQLARCYGVSLSTVSNRVRAASECLSECYSCL